jgi:hypothetical protein
MRALAGIATLCRQRGIEFDTFFYRTMPRSEKERSYSDQLFAEVSSVGNASGFHVSDTQSWWGGADRRSTTISAVDWHPNAHGHEILATGIANVLMAHALTHP